jgi:uncharacterized protein Yka (UPF0111/DUF47 family)
MNHCPRCGKDNPAEVHTCTPKALVLADELERHLGEFETATRAAAELRRQYEEIEGQADHIQSIYGQLNDTEKEVDDLRLLLRQALAQLEINRTNFYKAPSKSICKMLAGGNDEVITAIKERLGETT